MFVETIRRFVKTTTVLGAIFCCGLGASAAWSSGATSVNTQQPGQAPFVSALRHSVTSRSTMRSGEEEIDLGEIIATPTPTLVTLKLTSESDTGALVGLDMDIPMGSEATNTPTVVVVPNTPTPVATDTPTSEAVGTASQEVIETPTPEVSSAPNRDETEVTVQVTPTSTFVEMVPATPSPTVQVVEEKEPSEIPAATPVEKSRNVLTGKNVGLTPEWFNYLIQAGYLVRSASNVPKLGTIVASSHDDNALTTGMHLTVKLRTKQTVKEGDLLMVYRVLDEVRDPETNYSLGVFVKNLGILKVTRVEAGFVQADVDKAFTTFYKNDSVKSFEDELDRWKQSRRRRPLSADPIECSVASCSQGSDRAITNETIILSAGEDQGVVAGMDFELKKPVEATVYKKVWTKVGKARVFYVGGKYSMAKVLWNQDLILSGFRAQYQP